MVFTWGGRGPLDTSWIKPIWDKSLQQNLREFSIGSQITGTVLPEAFAYRLAEVAIPSLAATATTATTTAATAPSYSVVGGGGSMAGLGTLGAVSGASVLGLAATGAKIGFDVFLLTWLKDNWWIPALLIGAYAGVKLIK
jgi:hypothetical protein